MPYKDPIKRREMGRLYSAEWRQKNPERFKEVKHNYYLRNRRKAYEATKAWLAKDLETVRQYKARCKAKQMIYNEHSNQKFPDRILARRAIFIAIESGKIIPPSHCSNCGLEKKLHAHHHMGYDEDHRLSVIWLCTSCHARTHRPLG